MPKLYGYWMGDTSFKYQPLVNRRNPKDIISGPHKL